MANPLQSRNILLKWIHYASSCGIKVRRALSGFKAFLPDKHYIRYNSVHFMAAHKYFIASRFVFPLYLVGILSGSFLYKSTPWLSMSTPILPISLKTALPANWHLDMGCLINFRNVQKKVKKKMVSLGVFTKQNYLYFKLFHQFRTTSASLGIRVILFQVFSVHLMLYK